MNIKFEERSNIIKDELHFTTQIGRGTCATVFKGQYQNQEVAIKRSNTGYDEGLRNEVEMMLFLMQSPQSKDYIITLLGFDFSSTHDLLVLELMDETLATSVTTGRLVGENQLKVVYKLALGLHFLHTLNIVHRDIKPANILINTVTFDAKFCDLESAFIQEPITFLELAGSPSYMAPEILSKLKEKAVSSDLYSKVDVYSLCLTFWFIYAKITPYSACNKLEQLVKKVVFDNYREPFPPSMPEKLQTVIERGWFFQPDKRLTAPQLVEELEALKLGTNSS